jgi:hypothetical protein
MGAVGMGAGGEGSSPFVLMKPLQNAFMEETIMHSVNNRFAIGRGFRLTATATVGLAIVIASCTPSSFAQQPSQQTFPSAEAASDALFLAAQSGNEQVLVHILAGGKELVSSGDEAEDKIDREQFAQKYRQMHRLVRESDGTTLLYIGAENWPFPVPLVRAPVWYFDAKAGAQEIRFRRLGENEYTAIDTCHALVQASKQPGSNTTEVDRVAQYARSLINAQPAQISNTPSNAEEVLGPFHGYYFRILTEQRKGENGSDSKTGGVTVVAYPADYRSSGIMTFIVTQNDVVYETDLGPSTADVVKAMASWKRTSNWHVAE